MKNIFVGNLDFAATESSVRSLFEPYGAIERVSLVTDRETGRSRGFAFVEMTDAAEAEKAINALNGYNLDGRALNVNEARPKTEGGGGGRGFGGVCGGRLRQNGERRRRRQQAATPLLDCSVSDISAVPGTPADRSERGNLWTSGTWDSSSGRMRGCSSFTWPRKVSP